MICSELSSGDYYQVNQPIRTYSSKKFKLKKKLKLKELKALNCKAHIGIQGNEVADNLAKQAMEESPDNSIEISMEDCKREFKNETWNMTQESILRDAQYKGQVRIAANASAKKRRRSYRFHTTFETSVGKIRQNRLLIKLTQIIDEFSTRGQQAIVLVATPDKPNSSYNVFGAKPLKDVVKNLRTIIIEELENELAQQAPTPTQNQLLIELPSLIFDNMLTPVELMTQSQLRSFIPLMLKYATGRERLNWGKNTRPPWWPQELPWTNIREGDKRSEDEKQKISWTAVLRKIVIKCYKYHGREDLLPTISEHIDKSNVKTQQATPHSSSHPSLSQEQNGGEQSQQQQTVGVVCLNSTDSTKENSSPVHIIPRALVTTIQQTMYEFVTRGQQAVMLVTMLDKPSSSYEVFGTKPLEVVVKNLRAIIMKELENALTQEVSPPIQDDPSLFELPPLRLDGIPTPVEKMTQKQLKALISLLLKYSADREPGWEKNNRRPPWWPLEVAWSHAWRKDIRSKDMKRKISWTNLLRQIVINCYKYHGREDLLSFSEDDKSNDIIQQATLHSSSHPSLSQGQNEGEQSQQQQTVGVVPLNSTDSSNGNSLPAQIIAASSTTLATATQMAAQYPTTLLQTIINPDETVSIIQVDPSGCTNYCVTR